MDRKKMLKLMPPFRFALVCCSYTDEDQILQEEVYRGAYPTLRNFRFLTRLKLRSIISIIPRESITLDLVEFCKAQGIKHHCIQASIKNQAKFVEIAEILIRKENLPAYVHCIDGGSSTGLAVMCIRTLQEWSFSSITLEFGRYVKDKSASPEEAEFVSMFSLPSKAVESSDGLASWVTIRKGLEQSLKETGEAPTADVEESSNKYPIGDRTEHEEPRVTTDNDPEPFEKDQLSMSREYPQ